MKLYVPHKFVPREYQLETFNEFFVKKKKRFINIWHRRAGKDKTWLNIMIASAQTRVGTYLYTLPFLTQARKVIWEGIDKNGLRFIDHIPKSLIDGEPNNTNMTIRFKNGSILRFGGSDNYNSLMGTNPIGIIHSEFSLQNPLAWDYLRPILTENKGWAAFVFTPRGTNHAYKLFNKVKNNKDWFCNVLTVKDTFYHDGERIITDEMIEAERESGMSEDMIGQEFFCSFTSSVRGAYFSNQLRRMEDQERIKDFIVMTNSKVSTYWDLGVSDKTAIWLMQEIKGVPHMIMYYENHGKNIQHYINFLHDMREKYGFVYGNHYLPHDSQNRSLQTGKSLIDYARELGLRPVKKVKRCKKKMDAIEAARAALDSIVIHKENCKHGLSCLREYHAEFYDRIGEYGEAPFRNWATHGADAFMTYAQAKNIEEKNHCSEVYSNALRINL